MYQVAKYTMIRAAKPPSQTVLWVAAVVAAGGTVSGARQTLVNNLINGLQTDGIWTKLDRLWIYAAENAQSAMVDLKGLVSHTVIGTPTFTTDRGYTGVDSGSPTNYIETNFNPATNGVTFTQNSAHMSAWSRTNNSVTFGGMLIGHSSAAALNLYMTFSDNNAYMRLNDNVSSGSLGAPGTRAGFWLGSRTGASATQTYQNGSTFGSAGTTASGTVGSTEVLVLWGSPQQAAMVSLGGGLNSTEVTNFYNRLQTYMTAVGA